MREHHFRAWDKLNKKWLWPYPEPFHIIGEVTVFELLKQYSGGIETYNNIEIVESTGLEDKNGVEIYEGDIITWGNGNALVRMDTLYEGDDRVRTGWICEDCFIDDECEIVGNIYESPELLNE